VALDDGTTVAGRRLITRPAFRTLDGRELPIARVRQSLGKTAYVSFPLFPTVIMLPSAALAGRAGNDMIPTLLVAALSLPLALRRPLLAFAAPVAAFAIAGMVYNQIRFGVPTEFGHSYLQVRQQGLIEQYGLASYHYLARNLAVAFTLLPDLSLRPPYVQISG